MEKNKAWTFVLPLLNVYPTFGNKRKLIHCISKSFISFIYQDAMRLIQNIRRNPENRATFKMKHFSNCGVTEVFLEAVPTTFITTLLIMSNLDSGNLNRLLIGNSWLSLVLFWIGYVTSILTSAFGVSR